MSSRRPRTRPTQPRAKHGVQSARSGRPSSRRPRGAHRRAEGAAPPRLTTCTVEIRCLGPFEVLTGGTTAEVGGSKRQALLAMLALRRGRMVDVDALVDRLWGEELPAAPRNALHHHIARLRAALGDESIVGSSDGYALKSARLDAAEFEEAAGGDAHRVTGGRRRGGSGCSRVGARPLARAGVAGPHGHAMVQRRGAPARDAAGRRARGSSRSGSRSASTGSSRRPSERRSRTTPSANACGGS